MQAAPNGDGVQQQEDITSLLELLQIIRSRKKDLIQDLQRVETEEEQATLRLGREMNHVARTLEEARARGGSVDPEARAGGRPTPGSVATASPSRTQSDPAGSPQQVRSRRAAIAAGSGLALTRGSSVVAGGEGTACPAAEETDCGQPPHRQQVPACQAHQPGGESFSSLLQMQLAPSVLFVPH